MNDRKKLVLPILAVLSIILIVIGTTVAFFSYSKNGNTGNTINLGNITFHYDEISGKGRGINLVDAMPVDSDEEAKSSNDYFDFRITSNTSIAQIPYTITARLSEDSNLDNDIIKVYLTKVVGNTETEVLYTTLDQLEERTFLGGYIDKVLYKETVPVNGSSYEVNYRFRMWIAEDTDLSDGNYDNKQLSLTINVYTNDGTPLDKSNVTASDDTRIKMVTANNTYLLDESEEENVDYEVNVPNDIDEVDVNVITQNIAAEATVTSLGQSLAYGNARRINNSTEYTLLVGDNYFRVDVLAADRNTNKSYILDIVRELSKDNNLTYLAVENYAFTETFDKDTLTYHVSNAVEASSVNIIGNKSSDVASITGTGTKSLSWGENTFTVTVTPQDPNTQPKVYTIIINNQKPTAPTITGGTGATTVSEDQTISVLSPGTAISGVDHYEYYIANDSTLPTDNTPATGTTQNQVSITEDGTSYIYYRTVSSNGNKSVWSNSQIVTIESFSLTGLAAMVYNDGRYVKQITPNLKSSYPSEISGYQEFSQPSKSTNATSNYYIKYASRYVFDEGSGLFSLIGTPSSCKLGNTTFSGCGTNNNKLENKYTGNPAGSSSSSQNTTDMASVYKITYPSSKTITYYQITATAAYSAGNSGLYESTATNNGKPTYYFRGNVINNYVSFAGKTWRIVRINEDGTVRLIGTTTISPSNTINGENIDDKLYYSNYSLSSWLDNWFDSNITGDDANKVAEGNYFCEAAKVVQSSSYSSNTETSFMSTISSYNPTFMCQEDSNGHQYYTGKIGLISIDEVIYAGIFETKGAGNYNNGNYLAGTEGPTTYFRTMSSAGYYNNSPYTWSYGTGGLTSKTSTSSIAFYPVINLKADVTATGVGVAANPYVIQ